MLNELVTPYGLGAAVSLLLFWLAAGVYLRGKKVDYNRFCGFALCTAVGGWLMARLVFALCSIPTYINEYDNYFLPAFMFWDGGYAMTGAVIGSILGAWLAAKVTRTPAGTLLNAAGFGLPLGMAALRLTEFLCDTAESGDIGEGDFIEEGWVSDLLGRLGLLMKGDGDFCYPISLFSAVLCLGAFIALTVWLLRRRDALPGDVLMVSLVILCVIQMLMEPMRDDGHLTFHFVPFQQIVWLVIAVTVLTVWVVRCMRGGKKLQALSVVGIASVCIIVAVVAMFMIDRYENKVVAWSLLIFPMIGMGISALYLRTVANKIQGA